MSRLRLSSIPRGPHGGQPPARPWRASSWLPVALVLAVQAPLFAGSTVVGTGTPASCDQAALDAAIGVANGTFGIVTFNCGPAPHAIVVSNEKALANGVIVDGGGLITLSGGNASRIFNIFQGSAVEIRNITLYRGFAAGGGCVNSLSSFEEPSFLALVNVRFEECESSLFGAGLAATQTLVTIADSTFTFNNATGGGGGAISMNGGNLNMVRTTVTDNAAIEQGGGLQLWFVNGQIDQSTFSRNVVSTLTAGNGGGAVMLRGSTLTVSQTSFDDNSSGGIADSIENRGGAFLATELSDLSLNDVYTFHSIAKSGGALFLDATSEAHVLRSTFEFNIAGSGGAIFTSGTTEVAATTFFRNAGGSDSGTIRVAGGTLDMVSATVSDSFVVLNFPGHAALTWAPAATVNVHNTLITGGDFETVACHSTTNGNFTFSSWTDTSCGSFTPAGNLPIPQLPSGRSQRAAAVSPPPRPYGRRCRRTWAPVGSATR